MTTSKSPGSHAQALGLYDAEPIDLDAARELVRRCERLILSPDMNDVRTLVPAMADEIEALRKALDQWEGRQQVFICETHGLAVTADEDGCCKACGHDCAIAAIIAKFPETE